MTNMEKFKKAVKNQGGIWESDAVYFSQTRDNYWAQYMPNYPEDKIGDTAIIWDDVRREVVVSTRISLFPSNPFQKLYEKTPTERYCSKDAIKYVADPDFLAAQLNIVQLKQEEVFSISDELKDIDRELLGEVVFNEICSEGSGSLEDIGRYLMDVLYDCKTTEQYDFVNRTVMAITGSNLESIVEIIKNLEIEQDL